MEIAIINVDKFFGKLKISKQKLKKKPIFTIKPDIRPDIRSNIRHPAKLLAGYPAAGYPAKSVSGTTLVVCKNVVCAVCIVYLNMCPFGRRGRSVGYHIAAYG